MNNADFYKDILDSIELPVLTVDSSDFTVTYVNNAFINSVCNISIGEKISKLDFSVPCDESWNEIARQSVESGKKTEKTFFLESRQTWFNAELKCADSHIIFNFYDITSKRFYNEQLQQAIFTDTLTALPNRIRFNKDFSNLIHNENEKFALMIFDLDNMKSINDSKGLAEGDRILIRTAKIFKNFEREKIRTYRFGDDEFAVLATDITSADSAINIADTLLETFMSRRISISGGITIFPDDSSVPEDLLKFADLAMHHAKKDGRHRTCIFTPEMQKTFLRKVFYKERMPAAFEDNEFKLFFQPQFDIASNTLRGFEALIRWEDPEYGRIPPDDFIPIAEESGFIVKLGEWILNTAFDFQKKWETKYDYDGVMSINVSPVQLKEKNFLPMLQSITEKYGVNPSHIEIEITEGVLIENTEQVIAILDKVKQLGFGVSLDDFGTGYSSLRYLQILPLTTLKIDKSFIQNITESDGISAEITNSIISMVTKMGLDTIAEGVEKNDQLALLKSLNCKNVQGFLRGKPMSPERIEAFLSGNNSALDKL